MAFDERLAQRVRTALEGADGVVEKRMFGGVGFLLNGNMACGAIGDGLIVRVGPAAYQQALEAPFTRVFDFTGRPMKGWVVVTHQGYKDDGDLVAWVGKGVGAGRQAARRKRQRSKDANGQTRWGNESPSASGEVGGRAETVIATATPPGSSPSDVQP